MGYVNIHGQAVDLRKLHTPKRSKTKGPVEPQHKGFKVVGYSQHQVAAAQREHESRSRDFQAVYGYAPAPFDVGAWMRTARPQKISTKPLATKDAAETQKSLAERYGWIGVQVVPLTKGV